MRNPGRFDRSIFVDLPTLDGREEILKIHTELVKLNEATDLRRVARGTPGFSGADLANLVNEAALLAARGDADEVNTGDLEEARDKVRWGRERRSRVLDDKVRELTAYHEGGHAVVMALQDHSEPLHKVTIIPRGQSLGSTMQLPEKDLYTESKNRLQAMLVAFMGGRAAEELVFSDITTGAQNDLKQATAIARSMVCEWGMSALMGPQSFGNREEHLFLGREITRNNDYSEETARKIDSEVGRLLKDAYDRAMQYLKTNRDKLDTIAQQLLERETLDGDEVMEIMEHGRLLEKPDRESGVANSPVDGVSESSESVDDVSGRTKDYIPPLSGAPGPDASPA